MARVPLTTDLNQNLQIGSEVQFSGGTVEPVRDVVSDDIKRNAQAQVQLGQTINKLDDELNDAEATELANLFNNELENIGNSYLELEGGLAVKSVKNGTTGELTNPYDEHNSQIENTLAKYSNLSSNGMVKYMFEKNARVNIQDVQGQMVRHSLKQQRKYKLDETDASIELHKKKALNGFADYNKEDGIFITNYLAAHEKLKAKSVLEGWNIDPNAVNLKGEKIGVSEQYLKEKSELNLEMLKGVVDKFNENDDGQNLKKFLQIFEPLVNKQDFSEINTSVEKKQNESNSEKCVNAIINNNSNINNGDFITQSNKLMCLSSNHQYEDGTGNLVVDGHNTSEVITDNKKQSENIESLQQIRDTSKFYSSDSNLKGSLPNQHQTTHLFAIQKLGVKKADALYTKAKSEIEIDKDKYKNDITYANKINKKILEKYNSFIGEEVNKKFSGTDAGNAYRDTILNDLQIISKSVSFSDNAETVEVKVDPITSLRSLEELKKELKETITNEDTQAHAIKDLEAKYNKIKNTKLAIYNQELNAAKEIAFAEPNGWQYLAANGIKIEDFTKEDQEILKNGQPIESNKNVVIDLEKNPLEVVNNLPSYRHLLSQSDYTEFKRYAESLNSDAKVLAATVDSDMFDASLIRYGYTDIVNKVTDDPKAKDQYNFRFDYKQIKDAWKTRVDQEQIRTGKTLTRDQKQNILNEILADGVITKRWGLFRKSDITIPTVALEADQFKDAFVFVGSERIYVKRIPDEVRRYFIKGYEAANIPYTEQMIADEWVLHGKKKSEKEIIKFKEENNI